MTGFQLFCINRDGCHTRGGGALSIYTGGGVPRHIQKGGVLGTGTTQKGGLRHGHNPKKGGLRHGHESKQWGLRHGHKSK